MVNISHRWNAYLISANDPLTDPTISPARWVNVINQTLPVRCVYQCLQTTNAGSLGMIYQWSEYQSTSTLQQGSYNNAHVTDTLCFDVRNLQGVYTQCNAMAFSLSGSFTTVARVKWTPSGRLYTFGKKN